MTQSLDLKIDTLNMTQLPDLKIDTRKKTTRDSYYTTKSFVIQSLEAVFDINKFTIDQEARASYFRLNPKGTPIVKSISIDTQVILDVDEKGEAVGLEFFASKEMLDSLLALKKSGQEL